MTSFDTENPVLNMVHVQTFKLQLPLVSTTDEVMILVYNEDRTIEFEIAITPQLKRLFKGTHKVFHIGWLKDGMLQISGSVTDPGW